jgi:hypothetical protein
MSIEDLRNAYQKDPIPEWRLGILLAYIVAFIIYHCAKGR